jgi:hypothetical protein
LLLITVRDDEADSLVDMLGSDDGGSRGLKQGSEDEYKIDYVSESLGKSDDYHLRLTFWI